MKQKKTKKPILIIANIINVILAIAFLVVGVQAIEELKFTYVEKDTIRPDSLRSYLERENYGTVATLSHPIRGGYQPAEEDLDYFLLGEYADLLFLKEVFAETGKSQTAQDCETRISEIREQIPENAPIFDKIDLSAKNAIPE